MNIQESVETLGQEIDRLTKNNTLLQERLENNKDALSTKSDENKDIISPEKKHNKEVPNCRHDTSNQDLSCMLYVATDLNNNNHENKTLHEENGKV